MQLDDQTTRKYRQNYNNLRHFSIFLENSQKFCSLEQYVAIDEKLEGLGGKCGFVQYILNKSDKYGL